jgi:cytochrome c oxidase subunit 3
MSSAIAPLETTWVLPYRGKVGMACLIAAESAIFTIFVVAYLF